MSVTKRFAIILIFGLSFIIKNSFGQQYTLDTANNKPKNTAREFYNRINRATFLCILWRC